ncbi:sugar phosphate isomerase/epimerase family protein [Cohnella fermenti]|uniref:Sugar phosphate isomerase/epimerase n=1 Tax=Cohnella fermenti TaxID=2565925 RepID=A0A4S4BMF6_9BACL|nr:sugar phosphate isomerase/epimerase [Cohnella fermenti]THF73595.1 sugar phosphate isomerase/epimerase [Cohnella fermenti]
MSQAWRHSFRLGINHHLLFPASLANAEAHRATLPEVLGYTEFELVDMMSWEDGAALERQRRLVETSGKEPIYNCPLMNALGRNPHSPVEAEREAALAEMQSHLQRAKTLGARKAVIASGPNAPASQRDRQTELFVRYVAELCGRHPELTLMIEPFDSSIGKNLLIGPTHEAADVVERVRRLGLANIGLLIDMGHVPLQGETFGEALRAAAPYIGHVHLGSCIMRDPAHPLYGDNHPPWGDPQGENDVPEASRFLRGLLEVGYLKDGPGADTGQDAGHCSEDRTQLPTVTLEMRPYTDRTERDSVERFLEKLDDAWSQATDTTIIAEPGGEPI